ncbi:uncharacterized protein C1orf43 homolog [Lingula anatina]|uniref:Uncharacterized protein C1orf43 homolog n=1 Tax=Lingula anatina TaxID=7574 RepID=A0A1S3HWD2_LINAN|nr:uncharacterized protein C1orf43 homolog [Lingula anatina]XP_013389369.1 uncharacterized protein C1orf43 homolog [Lingula anatina]|eukprot:XP_013389367.1 uncharacterized protein C1orf43 homolog [Lingula anatina]
MAEEMSNISIVLFIACGTLTFLYIFIFAKRQISRFALKSTRKPHVPIGADAPEALKQEINRRLKRTGDIKYEPLLMTRTTEEKYGPFAGNWHFFYRMKAVDNLHILDQGLQDRGKNCSSRKPGDNLLKYLTANLPLASPELIDKFVHAYEHARHDPIEFGVEEYRQYMELLQELMNSIKDDYDDADGTTNNRDNLTKPEQITYIPPPNGSQTGMYRLLTSGSKQSLASSKVDSQTSSLSSVHYETSL